MSVLTSVIFTVEGQTSNGQIKHVTEGDEYNNFQNQVISTCLINKIFILSLFVYRRRDSPSLQPMVYVTLFLITSTKTAMLIHTIMAVSMISTAKI